MDFFEYLLITVGVILLHTILFFVPTYFIWNWIISDIFQLREIGIFEAIGIVFFVKILFSTTPDIHE